MEVASSLDKARKPPTSSIPQAGAPTPAAPYRDSARADFGPHGPNKRRSALLPKLGPQPQRRRPAILPGPTSAPTGLPSDNGVVNRYPYLLATALVAASLVWTVHLGVTPEPMAQDSALALAVGLVLFTIIDVAALLLARTRWSRHLGIAVVVAGFAVGAATELDGWTIAGLVLGAAAIAGLLGGGLRGWLRQEPTAGGPGRKPTALALGSLALLPMVAVASPDGLVTVHGVLASAGIVLSWAYSRVQLWTLWAFRLIILALAVAAALASPWWGAVLLVTHGLALTVLAWSKEARIAVQPLIERPAGSRSLRPAASPPSQQP